MSPAKRPQPYAGPRDPRLVTLRRGGSLNDPTHRTLAWWAADCAEHVLGLFTADRPGDDRPALAIAAARAWARDELSMATGREAAFAAHAAARETVGAARHVARAAGHAVATAHMADHELGPAYCALQAVATHADGDEIAIQRERQWQVDQLPPAIGLLVLDDMRRRAKKFRGVFDR